VKRERQDFLQALCQRETEDHQVCMVDNGFSSSMCVLQICTSLFQKSSCVCHRIIILLFESQSFFLDCKNHHFCPVVSHRCPITYHFLYSFSCAMTQAVTCWPVTSQVWVQCLVSVCEICSG
jgi:hypothetical protein